MRMEHYLTHTNYALWEVIVNGDAPAIALASTKGPIPPKTAKQKIARKNKLKAKSTLLLTIPDEHLLKFHGIKDVKSLWKAIKTSLPLAWNNIALIMRNKLDLDTMSMDDLYNNLKVYKAEIKRQSSSNSNSQNVAFVSSEERYEITSPEGYDLLLWGDLKTLFEPNEEDEIWKNQQDYNLISWRLFDSCGVHVLLMNTGVAIHMMIEKKYPLTQEMLSRMLNRRLEVDYESEMAFELSDLQDHNFTNGEDRLKLTELMDLCTNLQKKVLDLEKAKTDQDSEIASLKKKVKKLERRNKSRTSWLKRLRKVGSTRKVESSNEASLGDQEDASKQGRKIANIDVDAQMFHDLMRLGGGMMIT
ncbi:hypothetical protein Tco_0157218 [Tanacetum coccineum]